MSQCHKVIVSAKRRSMPMGRPDQKRSPKHQMEDTAIIECGSTQFTFIQDIDLCPPADPCKFDECRVHVCVDADPEDVVVCSKGDTVIVRGFIRKTIKYQDVDCKWWTRFAEFPVEVCIPLKEDITKDDEVAWVKLEIECDIDELVEPDLLHEVLCLKATVAISRKFCGGIPDCDDDDDHRDRG